MYCISYISRTVCIVQGNVGTPVVSVTVTVTLRTLVCLQCVNIHKMCLTNLKLIIMLRYHTEHNQLQLYTQITLYQLSAADGAVCNTPNSTTRLLPCTNIYHLLFQMTVCAVRSVSKLKNSATAHS